MQLTPQSFLATRSLRLSGRGKGAALATLLLLVILTGPASAALVNQKISGTMPAFGDVVTTFPGPSLPGPQISPDGQTVVYVADQETDEAFELWQTPIDGSSAPLRLSGLLPSGTKIQSFAISPDNSRVVYQAEQDTLGVVELYSVLLAGGPATQLNGPLVSGGDAFSFQISPDSSQVVYVADQQSDEVYELYRVPWPGGRSPSSTALSSVAGMLLVSRSAQTATGSFTGPTSKPMRCSNCLSPLITSRFICRSSCDNKGDWGFRIGDWGLGSGD